VTTILVRRSALRSLGLFRGKTKERQAARALTQQRADDACAVVMAGHSPSKTGVNALMSRPATFLSLPRRKTWMPGTRPGMTKEEWLFEI